jgi:hypothetical protein
MGIRVSFPGGKVQPGHDADCSPPTSSEVKKEQELYLLSHKSASMERNETTFFVCSAVYVNLLSTEMCVAIVLHQQTVFFSQGQNERI